MKTLDVLLQASHRVAEIRTLQWLLQKVRAAEPHRTQEDPDLFKVGTPGRFAAIPNAEPCD